MNAECTTKSKSKAVGILRSSCLRSALCLLTSAFLISPSGCTQVGSVAGLVADAIPKHIDSAYKGLAGQTVIVMVWLDRGLKMDYPELQMDIASGLQNKMIKLQKDEKPPELKETEFPVMASTVINYQEDHPEVDNEPITETASKFDGTRLIYVEVKDFATHAGAPELFRGNIRGDLKVVEMHNGKAKITYHEEDIEVTYPKDSPKDGLPIGTDYTITSGTVDQFTTDVSKRFYAHYEDQD